MEAECQQPLLSVSLAKAIHFYVTRLYDNGVSVLNKVQSSERKLVTVKRAAGNATQSNNEKSGELDALSKTFTSVTFKTKS